MQNYVKNSNSSVEAGLVNWLTENSALILIVGAGMSFLLTGMIQVKYYLDLFEGNLPGELNITIGILLAIFFQGVRCATLSSTAKLFSIGQRSRGFFILLISLTVTVYCSYEAGQVAALWEAQRPEIAGHIRLVLLCLVWSGWGLELVLIVNLSGEAAVAGSRPQPLPQRQPQHSNGHHSNFPNA